MASKEERAKQLKIDYEQTFATDHGKRVLMDILADCHVLEGVNTVETNAIMIKEGRRDAALNIVRKLTWTEKDLLIAVGGDV